MSGEQESLFKDYAEQKVSKTINENQLILDQYFAICHTIKEMGKDPKMTAKAWQRVMKGLCAQLTGEKIIYQSPVEEAMVHNLKNREGIKVHMIVNNERLLEAAKREMAAARKAAEDRAKALEEAQINVEPAVSPDDLIEKGDK